MLKRTAVAMVAVVGLVGAADAGARTNIKYPSTITLDLFECVDCVMKGSLPTQSIIAGGDVDSDKQKCVENRKVQLVAQGGLDAIDTDRTSHSGAWSGRGLTPLQGIGYFEARLLKKKVGAHTICEEDTVQYFLS